MVAGSHIPPDRPRETFGLGMAPVPVRFWQAAEFSNARSWELVANWAPLIGGYCCSIETICSLKVCRGRVPFGFVAVCLAEEKRLE
jgi:hypothetical protein